MREIYYQTEDDVKKEKSTIAVLKELIVKGPDVLSSNKVTLPQTGFKWFPDAAGQAVLGPGSG